MLDFHRLIGSLVVGAALGAAGIAHAQRLDGNAAAADAISDAVQAGHSPHRPVPGAQAAGNINSAECQELLEQFNATPKRAYQAGGSSITTSQGRVGSGIERDRSRDDLIDTFRAKCTH